MKKNFCAILFLFLCLSPRLGFGQPISSTELINKAKEYDNKTVTYSGEAVGDVMRRGEFAWVNAFDGVSAIGIWLSEDKAKGINFTGSFKSAGDIIEVEGVFHRACKEHGGDLDIHAASLKKIKDGSVVREVVNKRKRITTLILLGVLCLALIWTQLKIK